jgi:hypothetical protein
MIPPSRWTPEEDAHLISLRRQGFSFPDIATMLNKTQRSVNQRFLKLVPANRTLTKKKHSFVDMSEEMKVKMLAAVARRKTKFWNEVAQEVGGVTGAQCEAEWTQTVAKR